MLLPAFKFLKRVKLFRSAQFKTHLLVSLFYILTFCPQLPDSISVSLNVIHVTQFQGNCRGIHFLPESQFLFNFSSGSKTTPDLSLPCYGVCIIKDVSWSSNHLKGFYSYPHHLEIDICWGLIKCPICSTKGGMSNFLLLLCLALVSALTLKTYLSICRRQLISTHYKTSFLLSSTTTAVALVLCLAPRILKLF